MSEFKYGDEILVKNDHESDWKNRIFLSKCIKIRGFFCVASHGILIEYERGEVTVTHWDEAKAITEKKYVPYTFETITKL